MISGFFTSRPKLSTVIALAVVAVGVMLVNRLAISDYPEVAPPVISVSTTYSGAGPLVVADTVATPIEDEINSVDDLEYFDSSCDDSGNYDLYATFRPGINPDMALVNVQNAVKRAEPKLPGEVVQLGITVKKAPSDYILRYSFMTDGSGIGLLDLGDIVVKDICDELKRVTDVASVAYSYRDYTMRVWLDPVKMDALGISVNDIKSAISSQNIQPAAGFIGDAFASPFLSYKINVRGRLVTEEEFAEIVVRTEPSTGAMVRLRDVARCTLGCRSYASQPRDDGRDAFFLSVYRAPGGNSVKIAEDCEKVVQAWMKRLPKGVICRRVEDNTLFTSAILTGVLKSLGLALCAALAVMLLLTFSWRTFVTVACGLPPAAAGMVVALCCTGFSFDVFTAFALTLATGLVLSNGMLVSSAAARGGSASSDIWTGFALSVVCYAPLAFMGGTLGVMSARFATAILAATFVSSFLAVSLQPAVAERLFKGVVGREGLISRMCSSAGRILRPIPLLTALAVVLVSALCAYLSRDIRRSFLPAEDRGMIKVECELSEGSSLQRTQAAVNRMHDILRETPGIKYVTTAAGSSHIGKPGENHASVVLLLDPWEERAKKGLTLEKMADEVLRRLSVIHNTTFTAMFPDAMNGMGGYGGVTVFLCSIGAPDPARSAADAEAFAAKLRAMPQVKSAVAMFTASTPQLFLNVNRQKAQSLGVDVSSVFSSLQNKLASFYVNDFNLRGGAHQVIVQSDLDSRDTLDDAAGIYFPGKDGAMVPLASVGDFEYILGPRKVSRFNKLLSAGVTITPADGVTSTEVIDLIERDPPDPSRYVLNWSTLTYQERKSRGKTGILVGMALLGAYLILVIRYESWLRPFAVIVPALSVPLSTMAVMCALGMEFPVYAQLAMLFLLDFSMRGAVAILGSGDESGNAGGSSAAVLTSCIAFAVAMLMFALPGGVGAASRRALACGAGIGSLVSALVAIFVVPAFRSKSAPPPPSLERI